MNTREDELGPAVRLEEPKTSRQCKGQFGQDLGLVASKGKKGILTKKGTSNRICDFDTSL